MKIKSILVAHISNQSAIAAYKQFSPIKIHPETLSLNKIKQHVLLWQRFILSISIS